MNRTHATIALLSTLALATAGSALADTQGITLRVAPEGFVAPSLHWTTDAFLDTTTPTVWVIDPAEDPTFNDQDGVAGCTLPISSGSGSDVLDQATATGCISGWDSVYFDGQGRFVTSADGLEQVGWPASWWVVQVDGEPADVGVDSLDLTAGQDLSLIYVVGP